MSKRALVVGCGFAGAVSAQKLASAGWDVTILEKRAHIGGNAYDEFDANGILIHPYGPHIFHTNSKRIFEYLSQFTSWRFYEHRVLAKIGAGLYPIPINRTTLNRLYSLNLDESGAQDYLASVRENRSPILTSEDSVLNAVGPDLCDKFFRGYTQKQWGLDLSELSVTVAARVPTRTNDDDRYFTDAYQFMPADGYTRMFERMLDHPNITINLKADFCRLQMTNDYDHTIYTGPIDAYYEFKLGRLPYRSIQFNHEHLPGTTQFQSTGTINYPDFVDGDFTRITEFKHLTGQISKGTSIVKEFSVNDGDPYYPVLHPNSALLYEQYQQLAIQESRTTFIGRLAQYRYYNMDQVVGAAISATEKIIQANLPNKN